MPRTLQVGRKQAEGWLYRARTWRARGDAITTCSPRDATLKIDYQTQVSPPTCLTFKKAINAKNQSARKKVIKDRLDSFGFEAY